MRQNGCVKEAEGVKYVSRVLRWVEGGDCVRRWITWGISACGSSMVTVVICGELEVKEVEMRVESLKRRKGDALEVGIVELAEICYLIETLKKKP